MVGIREESITSTSSSSNSYDPLGFTVPADAKTIIAPSFSQLVATLKMLQAQFGTQSPPESQYLHVSGLHQTVFEKIVNDETIFQSALAMATVCNQTNEILYKVIPSAQHAKFAQLFSNTMMERLGRMGLKPHLGHWVGRGLGRAHGWTCSKEPNGWFEPNDVLVSSGGGGYPSLILEVGLSQSYAQLRNDAYWWHGNSDIQSPNGDRQTKMVVLASLTGEPAWRIDIEVWTEVPDTQPMRNTRSRSTRTLERTQHVCFENGVVHGGPLVLSFDLMMRRRPSGKETDIVLDDQILADLCHQVMS
ncbi:hypothetical protein N7466_003535 [Penicillium verhagenii]|uniref:uncharacterized protein n=1 Tax=Penicillium verhagenii TaxID=1562060 RepID=UPI002545337C|nr:uncharacterized protein N7466_003535 [Penicillium verhagenii]KAJ5937085.1 hypothetical protein N7466_003535 [Penicillium verhagenii]